MEVRPLTIAAALVAGVGLSACDGDASSNSANDRIKSACDLFTTSEVSAFMGTDMHPVSDDEAKRLERAAADLIVQRLKPAS